jgi:hypothetical protein
MRHTITGLVAKPVDAQRIIDELTSRCMSDRSDISLIAQENGSRVTRMLGGAAQAAGRRILAVPSSASASSRTWRANTLKPCARARSSSWSTPRPTPWRSVPAK